MGHGDV